MWAVWSALPCGSVVEGEGVSGCLLDACQCFASEFGRLCVGRERGVDCADAAANEDWRENCSAKSCLLLLPFCRLSVAAFWHKLVSHALLSFLVRAPCVVSGGGVLKLRACVIYDGGYVA